IVVVQEDTENCSVGQMIISHITSRPDFWNEMVSPPILVSKANVVIGYNPIYEYAALPDVDRIISAVKRSASITTYHTESPIMREAHVPAESQKGTPDKAKPSKAHVQIITVPIMGEGIRSAKMVSLLKNPGEAIALDDELCEVETDKAVYPIQSSFAGVMGEWKTKVGDTVEIGQELGTIVTSEPAFAEQFEAVAKESSDRGTVAAAVAAAEPGERGRHD